MVTHNVSPERAKGIGASEAYRAINLDYGLWAEKTGLADPPDLSTIERIKWGNRLEGPILQAYQEETGREVVHNDTRDLLRHDEHLFMVATIDAMQQQANRPIGLVEVKTTSQFMAKDWEEEPPLRHQVQLQHQLAVTGMDWGTLVVLIGGQAMRWFDQNRNDKFIDAMVKREIEFWEYVAAVTPPPADSSVSCAETLKRLYPDDSGEIIALPPEAAEWDKNLQLIKADLHNQEAARRLLENKLKAALGSATVGVLSNGDQYTWKKQTSHHAAKEAYDSTFRVLRRRKG